MSITRRSFLEYVSLVAASGCVFSSELPDGVVVEPPLPSPESPDVDLATFPYGVMAGDMEALAGGGARAIVWTRCLAGALDLVVWEKATHRIAHSGPVAIGDGGFVHADVATLAPGTRYRYQFRAGSGYSDAGEFATPPAPGTRGVLVFGATSCTHQGAAPGTRAIELAASEELDCFFHLGDHVYNDAETWLTTLDEFRAGWERCFELPYMRAAHARHGTYFTWDDHEIINNWDHDWIAANPMYRPSVEHGTRTYFEHHPIRRDPGQPDRLWRSFRWGDTAEFFLLDLRGERHEDVERRIMSRAQRDWLVTRLAQSTAVFKFVMNPIPICTMPPTDTHAADRWEGFATDRAAVLAAIRDAAVENVWWISGDYHVGAVGHIGRYGYRWYGMREVMMGPGAGTGAAEAVEMAAYVDGTAGERQWPFVTGQDNYVVFTADPDARTVRVVFRDGSGNTLHDHTYDAVYTPARAVSGPFAAAHAEHAAVLGHPLTEAHPTLDGGGEWQQFARGYIYRSAHGAFAVHGKILDRWASLGWSQSWLGYPIGNAYAIASGREQAFENGFITETPAGVTTRT